MKTLISILILISVPFANAAPVSEHEFLKIMANFGIRTSPYSAPSLTKPTDPVAAIQASNQILAGREIPPEFLQRMLYAALETEYSSNSTYPSLYLSFLDRGTGEIIAGFLDGLSKLNMPIDFRLRNYLRPFLKSGLSGGFSRYFHANVETVVDKLIQLGQDPKQCGFLTQIIQYAPMPVFEKYLSLVGDVNQESCDGFDTAFSIALLGVEYQSGILKLRQIQRSRELVLYLYSKGADLFAQNFDLMEYYLNEVHESHENGYIPQVSPILVELYQMRPFDLKVLEPYISATLPRKMDSSRVYFPSTRPLKELIALGVNLNGPAQSPLWKMIHDFDRIPIDASARVTKAEFVKLLVNAGADFNYEQDGKSIIKLLRDQAEVDLVVMLCNRGALDPICNQ